MSDSDHTRVAAASALGAPPTLTDAASVVAPPPTQVEGGTALPRLDGATQLAFVTEADAATVCPQPTRVDELSAPPVSRTGSGPGRDVATTFTSAANAAWEKGAVVAGRY